MKTLSFRVILVSLFLLSIGSVAPALAQLTGTGIEPAPNYDTFVPPPVGGSYVDPVFGSTIKRVSNALGTPNADGGGYLTWIEDEYSAANAFNNDNSKFILVHQSYFALYDGSGFYLHDLPFEINSSSEPRWSRKDNVTLYYHSGNMLKSYNISTGGISVVHTFSEYSSISGNGEMDISLDGDHFVYSGNGRYIFVYQISTDAKFPVFDTAGRGFDSVYITPNNNVIVSWPTSGTVRYTGQELFDINMNFLRQVGHADGHKHLTRDTNGSEVLIWTNSNDAQPIANCNNGIVKINLADATQTCLAQLDWSLAVHITAPDGNGSAYVETYAPSNPEPGSSGWVAYTNELLQVKLDGSGVVRWAHHRSRPLNSYNYQPKMTVSRDGTRALYASNYDLQNIDGYTTEYSDTYLITLGGSAPPPPTPPPPAPALSSAAAVSATEIDTAWVNPAGSTATGNNVLRCLGSACTPSTVVASLSATAVGYHDTSVASSTTYTYLVQASNAGGSANSNMLGATTPAPPPPPTLARYEQDNPAVQYTGTWFPKYYSWASGGSIVMAMDPGAQAKLTFTGTGVKWIGYRDQWSGTAGVYVDGVFKTSIDTFSRNAQSQVVNFSIGSLSNSTHTIVIYVNGAHNRRSAGSWVWVDAFDVTQ